jgi:ankyrin repeat protein
MKGIGILTLLISLSFSLPAYADIDEELFEEAWHGHTKTVNELLTKGANVNTKDKDGIIPL